MRKYFRTYAMVWMALIFIVTACGGTGTNEVGMEDYYNEKAPPPAAAPMAPAPVSPEEMSGVDGGFSQGYGGSESITTTVQEEKRIKNAVLDVETKDFDGLISNIKATVANGGGYVENYNAYIYAVNPESKDLKGGTILVRVPSKNYPAALEQIKTFAKVRNINESEELATERYYDIEARMKTIKLEEERILVMIEKAVKLEDLIMLEQRLSSIRENIELYQSQLNQIDRKSSFSTITINITEVINEVTIQPVSTDFFSKISNSFKSSINATLTFFENLLVFIAGAAVPFLTFGIIVSFIVFVVVKLNKKR